MYEFFLSVIIPGGVSALIFFFTKNWFLERLRHSIRHEYDEKLERLKNKLDSEKTISIEKLKAEVAKDASIITTAFQCMTESQSLAQRYRVEGVAKLWKAMLQIRNLTPAALTFLDILLPSEYPAILNDPKCKTLINGLGHDNIDQIAKHISADTEDVRPFVGEYLWSLFFSYQIILLRISLITCISKEKGRLKPWVEDSATIDFITAVASSEEMLAFKELQFGHFTWMRQLIERKFLLTANSIISGKVSTDFALEQAYKISRATTALSKNTSF